jgi:hypothetical protein
MRKLIFGSVTLLSGYLLVGGCNSSKMTFGNGDKWIPADFVPAKTVLLVEKYTLSNKVEEKIEAYMNENYPYKYEFVGLDDIKNRSGGKYANTKLYKYALVIYATRSTYTYTDRSTVVTAGYDYYFYDREISKNYRETGKASTWILVTFKPIINTIVKKFE